jgi:hypothetical protein
MKKNVLVFGLIAGAIVSFFMVWHMATGIDTGNWDNAMLIGYASMIVAFSFVFVGIKNYRDKYNGGVITFGKAFMTGLWITLIASTMYVVVWMIYYHFFVPDFMDKYAAHMIEDAKAAGQTAAQIEKQMEEIAWYKEMYKNPLFVFLFTYLEILPVGLLITLISSFILKRKQKNEADVVEA